MKELKILVMRGNSCCSEMERHNALVRGLPGLSFLDEGKPALREPPPPPPEPEPE
jgi:hypothetical protein